MKHKILVFLILSALWPIRANDVSGRSPVLDFSLQPAPERLESIALSQSLRKLQRRRYSPLNQGILVESLDATKVLAELNSDVAFNPASVLKIATSFMALHHFGPDYRFQTAVYGEAELDQSRKRLPGNLYVLSDGNPVFQYTDALSLARTLVRRGLHSVEGNLIVDERFCLNENFTAQRSADRLRRYLRRIGIIVKGQVEVAPANSIDVSSKVHFLSHYSEPLRKILWVQNAHSVNEIADRAGALLGGSQALQSFLTNVTQVDPEEIFVDRPSGLGHNRITAQATVRMLRELNYWLEEHEMKMQNIMPVAGVDEGTLFGRFRHPEFRGAVLGKTGTNPVKDGGVSSLAGIAYTRDHGPVVYAILNSHGNVLTYRRWQDDFLRNVIEESGGVGEYLSSHAANGDLYKSPWLSSPYWDTLDLAPLAVRSSSATTTKSAAKRTTRRARPGSSSR